MITVHAVFTDRSSKGSVYGELFFSSDSDSPLILTSENQQRELILEGQKLNYMAVIPRPYGHKTNFTLAFPDSQIRSENVYIEHLVWCL